MKLSEVMKNPRLKVKRAESHINALMRDSSPLSRDLYEIRNGLHRSHVLLAQPDCFALTFTPKEPIKEHFGAIMGDAVNNLREALDYWMNNAVQCVGPAKKVHFPFAQERKDLETSPNYPAVHKAFPDAAKFIAKEIEPCRDTNLDLWAVTSLCNDNKHNDFLPTVTVMNIDNINLRAGGIVMRNCGAGWDANGPMTVIQSGVPISMQNNFSTSVEIRFPQGAVFENQPVIPTLANMSKVVSQTLNALEKFITPYCK
ncbi:hypothetical protein [Mesorhizobium sp. J8]|uniref:hypothetical protein n=1 Tax=Mesorhizobium sp. J8 TaxID=2777475 RepID=UPI00191589FF|nr:hypothetical protein [Mesorhizobium sp. J8]